MIKEIEVDGRLYQSRSVNNLPRRWFYGFAGVDEETTAFLDALAAAQAETADWKANAQRENAMLVQAQQRIAELEQEREDVRRVEEWRAREPYGRRYSVSESGARAWVWSQMRWQEWRTADSLAALGRMLKEGENG